MGMPSLLMMKVVPRVGRAARVSMGLEGVLVLLEATISQVCLDMAGGGGGGRIGSPGAGLEASGGGGRAAAGGCGGQQTGE